MVSDVISEPGPSEPDPQPLSAEGIFYVSGPNAERPYVRYADGQLSAKESCAIRLGNKLNRRVPPAYVNGSPIGFC